MKALIYTKDYCSFCDRAKEKLEELGIDYIEVDVTYDIEKQNEMIHHTGRQTVPQIFFHVGGSDDLFAALEEGKLDGLMDL